MNLNCSCLDFGLRRHAPYNTSRRYSLNTHSNEYSLHYYTGFLNNTHTDENTEGNMLFISY